MLTVDLRTLLPLTSVPHYVLGSGRDNEKEHRGMRDNFLGTWQVAMYADLYLSLSPPPEGKLVGVPCMACQPEVQTFTRCTHIPSKTSLSELLLFLLFRPNVWIPCLFKAGTYCITQECMYVSLELKKEKPICL